jgi:transcriptional regulator with XRE-family HTH domain
MSEGNLSKIGAFISELRKEKQFTQKELADQLSVTDKAVSKWERGLSYPDISLVSDLAQILGVTINELLSGEKSNDTALKANRKDHFNDREIDDKLEDSTYRKKTSWKKVLILLAVVLLSVFVFIGCNITIERGFMWVFPPIGITLSFCLVVISGVFFAGKYKIGSGLLCGSLIYFITYYYAALNSYPNRSTTSGFTKIYLPHYTIIIIILLVSIGILATFFSNKKGNNSEDISFFLGGLSISVLIISFLTISAIIDFVDLNGLGVNPIYTILLLLANVINLAFLTILSTRYLKTHLKIAMNWEEDLCFMRHIS